MQKLKLSRIRQSKDGTFGIMTDEVGNQLCVTCEDPWNFNARQKSCVPAGRYRCSSFTGKKYRNVWQLHDVPNRDAILIHNGNTIDDTQGCILVGKAFSRLIGKPSITESKLTLEKLRSILLDEFELTIVDTWRDGQCSTHS